MQESRTCSRPALRRLFPIREVVWKCSSLLRKPANRDSEATDTLIRAAFGCIIRSFRGPLGSPVCPTYEMTLEGDDAPLRLTLYPGFGRWNHDILKLIRRRGGTLREAADMIITGVADDNETPLLVIEYCGALPAGNQAWQRSGRAYSFGKARVATRYNVAVLATVGAPKQKGKDRYFGRDALFGSAALARKVETVVLMSLHNEEDPNSARRCWILPRAGRAERMYFIWQNSGLQLTTEPDAAPEDSAFARVTAAGLSQFKADWNHALLAALAVQRHQQIVKIDVTDAQLEHFANPRPGVEEKEQDQMETALQSSLRFPLHQQADLLVRECGQHILRLF